MDCFFLFFDSLSCICTLEKAAGLGGVFDEVRGRLLISTHEVKQGAAALDYMGCNFEIISWSFWPAIA